MSKIGRNEPCPCGSGLKFKKCCGSISRQGSLSSLLKDRIEATELQRRQQQGHGRPIQAFTQNDGKIVVVGKRLFRSPTAQTFHDFLLDYVGVVMGQDWFSKQMALPAPHPAADWANSLNEERRQPHQSPRKACNGTRSLLALAYNLYLIEHHYKQYKQPLIERLLRRLRQKEDFFPTLSETYAAAAFLKSGFNLEYEDDRSAGEHAEFIATFPTTGRKFSVEVKTRSGIDRTSEGTSLRFKITKRIERALSKNLPHERVVWIDVNIPDPSPMDGSGWIADVVAEVDQAEAQLTIGGKPAPPAYLFVTNQPYHYNANDHLGAPVTLALGFKIDDFQSRNPVSFRDVVMSRKSHPEMHELLSSLVTHTEPPVTFDGQAPEIAFAKQEQPPLLVGNDYVVLDRDGAQIAATLESAAMMESEKTVYGIYRTKDQRQLIVTSPVSDEEVAGWRRHPETFFGKVLPTVGELKTPIDLAEHMYKTFQHTPKDQLLKNLADHPAIDTFRTMSQEELAIAYCDICTATIVHQSGSPKKYD
ncbi:YecA family protein [Tardiphaga robiniae]|uniref:YecA family protein n=1 Tax=Tardiphaga robiniae TaxID=943830 RepID=UPI001AEE037B|nr:SEC-C metal-binding domain-containing protein [Tardiphaga robiniae]